MSDILFLPVKPKWAKLIMSGQETLELSHPTLLAKPVALETLRCVWGIEPPQQWRYIDAKTFNEIVEAGR